MVTTYLYQIAYSPESLARIEPGYLVLDNLANPRPDWYEIDPIRRYLHELENPDEGAYYGFFSPKFATKTGLNREQVEREINTAAEKSAAVVLFSPQPDMGAFFLNVFEQGETFDPGLMAATQAWLEHAGMHAPPLGQLVMDTRVTVFSNYFAARPAFWREWLRWVDNLFEASESGPEVLRSQLVHATTYPGAAQRKVFIQERVASLILTLQPHWRTHAANPFRMAWSATRFLDHPELAVMSDALKRAHRDLGFPCYMQAFGKLRERFQQGAVSNSPHPLPISTPDAIQTQAFTAIPSIEAECQLLFESGHNAACMARMMVGVHEHYKSPGVGAHALFYPGFDRLIEKLGVRLASTYPATGPRREQSGNTLIIATQIHDVGGHSRVIDDVIRETARPMLVLTDAFQFFRNEPQGLQPWLDAYADTGFLILRQHNPWDKARELWQLVQRLAPDEILYFHHHQDPVPFVGTLGYEPAKKVLFHHADHNPSLGATLTGLSHVDFTAELAAVCSSALGQSSDILPLYVADGGYKQFVACAPGNFSVVTSGTEIKFQRVGPLALSAIVVAALQEVRGSFFFVGPLPDDWQAEIRQVLTSQGLMPERFQALGAVPSLWHALHNLDAHVYIGSAPAGGGRAAIEAQGCGYPLLFYRIRDRNMLTAIDSVYADSDLGWSTPAELQRRLRDLWCRLPEASRKARLLYENQYSRARFRHALSRHARLRDD